MKKRVWLWNHYATEMFDNKGGRHYWFAEKLIKFGYEPTVFCANTFHNKTDFIDTGKAKFTSIKKDDIPFVFVKTKPSIGNGLDRVKNMIYFFMNLFFVSKKWSKDNGSPDIILASSVHPLTMVAGILISKKFKVPCICEVRDLWPEAIFAFNKARSNSMIGRILIKGERWIYENADALIFTKEGDVDYIIENGWNLEKGGKIDLKKIHYINNGVNIDQFNMDIETNTLEDDDLINEMFNVVYVGAIRPVNNVEKIVETAELLKNYDDIQFLVYGSGNEREKLEQKVKNGNLTNIKFKGSVNKQYIPYILSKSSVNLLNYSQNQYNWSRGNSSNKLFEYMASGKPIISTVKMGYSIIEKYNCGIEIYDASPQDLAEAILKVKNMKFSELTEMSKNAKIGAEAFDMTKLTEELVRIIETC